MEATKKALHGVLKVVTKFIEANQDDKITNQEKLMIAFAAVGGGVGIFKHLGEIKDELKNFKKENIAELVTEFKEDFDLPDDVLEQKIEAGLDMFAQMISVFFETV